MNPSIDQIAESMKNISKMLRPFIGKIWDIVGRDPGVKVTIILSIDGMESQGNMVFTNNTGDIWDHQERLIREFEANKRLKGKTMVEFRATEGKDIL